MKNIFNIIYILLFIFIIPFNLISYVFHPIRFNKGETLVYDITAFNIKVGTQKTVIKDIITFSNRKVYYIRTSIKTTPAIDKLYKLDNIDESYIDIETLQPLFINSTISEGEWKNNIIITIDPQNKKVNYLFNKYNKNFKYNKVYLGLISVLYFFRSIKTSPNEVIEFTVNKKREKEDITTHAKYIPKKYYVPALKRQVNSLKFEGINDKKAELWITNDEYRIPYEFTFVKIPLAGYGYINFINKLNYYYSGIKN